MLALRLVIKNGEFGCCFIDSSSPRQILTEMLQYRRKDFLTEHLPRDSLFRFQMSWVARKVAPSAADFLIMCSHSLIT